MTRPLEVVTATSGLVLYQIPAEAEDRVVLKPKQISSVPDTDKVAGGNTVMLTEELDVQPVDASVKRKDVVPVETAVTKPVLEMVATAGLPELQVPPLFGSSCVLSPIHNRERPLSVVPGLACTVTGVELAEAQPVAWLVNTKEATPWARAVTIPALSILAIVGFNEVQVPPEFGEYCVVAPMHKDEGPIKVAAGLASTVIGLLKMVSQPVLLSINLKLADPSPTPVTKPEFETVATAGVREIHVPPAVGVS